MHETTTVKYGGRKVADLSSNKWALKLKTRETV